MSQRKLQLVLLMIVLIGTQALRAQFQSPNPRPTTTKKNHTRVQLVANVDAVQPGVPFTVGMLMTMEKGWHTYWRNAGEAGLPTDVQWSLPNGFSAGELQWPLPHKYNESGDVLTYGYADENMLLAEIMPPSNLKPNTTSKRK
jgi:DsbC/DsbD-like thiol-disulfide interchange protein